MRGNGRKLAGVLIFAVAIPACRQAPRQPSPEEIRAQASEAARARRADPPPPPTDPRTLRFHRVDLLISQWDVAQASGRLDQAEAVAQQIRREVDQGYQEFLEASRGSQGIQLQYLAVSALGFATSPQATQALVDRLQDRDPKLVGNALIALKIRADVNMPILPVLQHVTSTATEPRRYAPLALAHVLEARRTRGYPPDVVSERQIAHALSGVVADRDPFVRLHAAKALGALRIGGTYELLMILMKDEHVRIRIAAAAGLERLADPRGFPEVIRLLADAPEDTKPIVRDLLVSYGEKVQRAPIPPDQLATLGTSALAWSRWYDDVRVRLNLPVEDSLLAPGVRPAGTSTPAAPATVPSPSPGAVPWSSPTFPPSTSPPASPPTPRTGTPAPRTGVPRATVPSPPPPPPPPPSR